MKIQFDYLDVCDSCQTKSWVAIFRNGEDQFCEKCFGKVGLTNG